MPTANEAQSRILLGEPAISASSPLVLELIKLDYSVFPANFASDMIRALNTMSFDIVVASLDFSEDPGLSFLEPLAQGTMGQAALIVTTTRPSLDTALRAMRAGAQDYLTSPVDAFTVQAAVERVTKLKAGLAAKRGVVAGRFWGTLSGREREVVEALYGGSSPQQIAGALAISHYTVRNHLRSIYSKLGVHSQRELLSLGRPQAPTQLA